LTFISDIAKIDIIFEKNKIIMRNLYEIPILLYETTRDWGQRSGLSERLPERAKEKEEIKKNVFS
jgi:hypothetical protein